MATSIRFYFDFNSSFSYIAIHRIDELAAKYGRSVDWRAISLGHLFQAQNIVPPPSHPAKFKYLSVDFARSCAMAGLPCVMPKTFPPDVRLARYMFWRLKAQDEALAHRFAKLVSMAIFGRGEDMATAGQIAAASAELNLGPSEIEAAAGDSTAKKAVVSALDAAVADGMIGAPFMVLEGEGFWGADRLDQLEWRLAALR
ncbi:MAG: 2-hydroxychromene-2-carboxylate isomerase [Rhodospirillaceae bacterium]|nr:2-hydroxychromene-2-carboxylate isomerase [Rhodospirillaceae bacterium]